MRNPARIPIILTKLKEIWERNPDLRFGQLVENIRRGRYNQNSNFLFYLEDESFERLMGVFVNELKNKNYYPTLQTATEEEKSKLIKELILDKNPNEIV